MADNLRAKKATVLVALKYGQSIDNNVSKIQLNCELWYNLPLIIALFLVSILLSATVRKSFNK